MGSAHWQYQATIVRWVDGDTVEVSIDLGFRLTLRETVRVFGINAPERNTGEPGKAARLFAEGLAPVGCQVLAETVKTADKYGRWLAKILLPDGRDLSSVMVEAGHAKVYLL